MFQSPLPLPAPVPFMGPMQSQMFGPLQQSQTLGPLQQSQMLDAFGGFGFFGPGNDTINVINSAPGPAGPPGPPGPPGPAGTPGIVPITQVTSTPYTALLTDYVLAVDVAAPASIVLPASPLGTVFVVKDSDGDAQTNPITVTASTTIDGLASYVINVDYASITLVFTGTEWNVI